MKIASSLKSLKKRDIDSKLVKRRGKVTLLIKKSLDLKLDRAKVY
jgi:ribosomal protein L36